MKTDRAILLWEAIGGAEDAQLLASEAVNRPVHRRTPMLVYAAAAILFTVALTLGGILRFGIPSGPGLPSELTKDFKPFTLEIGPSRVTFSMPGTWELSDPSPDAFYTFGNAFIREGGENGDPIRAFVGLGAISADGAHPLVILNNQTGYSRWDLGQSYRVIFLDDKVETALTKVNYDFESLPEDTLAQMQELTMTNTAIISINRESGVYLTVEFSDGIIGHPPLEDGMAEAIASSIIWSD